MIQNLTDLARECGSNVSDVLRQRTDVVGTVLSHSDGLVRVWLHADTEGLNLVSKYGRTTMRFPFEGDAFWQNIEWLHEEALIDEEDYQAGLLY